MAGGGLAGGTPLKLPPLASPWPLRVLRWAIGAVFVYAGTLKLLAPQDFADSIAGFRLLSPLSINVLALSLPPFEILVGTLLLLGWRTRAASLAVLLMTTIFALALASALLRGLSVDCGCFGGGTASRWRTSLSLGRDLLLFGTAAVLYRQAPG